VTWQEPPEEFAQALRDIGDFIDDEELVLIHVPGRVGPAVELFAVESLCGVDAIVWGPAEGALGSVDPSQAYPYAFAIRGAFLPSLARATTNCESIWDVLRWILSTEWVDRLRLMVLPADGYDFWEVSPVELDDATLRPISGLLPEPRWMPGFAAERAAALHEPEPLPLPIRTADLVPDDQRGISLEEWARTHSWLERVRLALPWRWGLLEKAMGRLW
jgi:hypothetical protein